MRFHEYKKFDGSHITLALLFVISIRFVQSQVIISSSQLLLILFDKYPLKKLFLYNFVPKYGMRHLLVFFCCFFPHRMAVFVLCLAVESKKISAFIFCQNVMRQ